MVSRSYLLEKPRSPSRLARLVQWTITPAVINSLGAADEGLEQLRRQVRRSTLPTLASAFALGAFMANRHNRR
jgi:hypothetical protein